MASCLLKSFCGCCDLKTGSTVIGFIILVLQTTWLGFIIKNICFFAEILRYGEFRAQIIIGFLMTMIHALAILLEVIFAIVLLVGVFQQKRQCLRAFYIAIGVLCLVEWIMFVISAIFYGIHFPSFYATAIFTSNMLTKLFMIFSVVLVRSYYHQTAVSNTGAVYSPNQKPNAQQPQLGLYYAP